MAIADDRTTIGSTVAVTVVTVVVSFVFEGQPTTPYRVVVVVAGAAGSIFSTAP
jgi:hypothetical protein